MTSNYVPYNASTGKAYQEGNVLILTLRATELNGLNDPRWLTFLQAKELGFHVKKGAKSAKIAFCTVKIVKDEETGKDKEHKVIKHYNVFHASQIEGIPPYKASQGE